MVQPVYQVLRNVIIVNLLPKLSSYPQNEALVMWLPWWVVVYVRNAYFRCQSCFDYLTYVHGALESSFDVGRPHWSHPCHPNPTSNGSVPTVGFQRLPVVPMCSHVFPRAVFRYLSIRFHVTILGNHPWKPLWITHRNPREQSMETWVQSMETFGDNPWKLGWNLDETFTELW